MEKYIILLLIIIYINIGILYRFKELDTIGSECVEVMDFSKLTELIDPPIPSDIISKCQDFLRKKCEGTLIPFRDIEMLLKPYVYHVGSIEDNIKNYFYFEPEVLQSTNVQSNSEWNCSSCTFKNKSSNILCEICNSAKPTSVNVYTIYYIYINRYGSVDFALKRI